MIYRLELLSRTSNQDKTVHFISNDVGAIQSEQQCGLVINIMPFLDIIEHKAIIVMINR